ncbi:acyl carrier protein [Streptomyces sp. RS10V-4]|uniref:acyl carrier protein n=1 Tax=Streptomyces rhizoryzae TaxID=2932493 RepID=UPI0020040A73|nr:acyl carrier protein [Streptomyces rhizoryzae]MCK7625833.1 acyl carrier protein [Streptomyces rhizoryzae]
MAAFTLDDLRRILVSCAGENDGADLHGDILDTPFRDLGYDSLALMETAARVEREYGIDVSDDDIAEVETPRGLLGIVNDALGADAA